MNCIHYYSRIVKDMNGIPYDYEHGCYANYDLTKCDNNCPGCNLRITDEDARIDESASSASTYVSSISKFIPNNRHERRKQKKLNRIKQ